MTADEGGEDGAATGVAPRPGLRGAVVMGLASLAGRLPEGPLLAAADASGELWYRVAPAKRAQARANLQRVCEGLAASGRGSGVVRRAATDPDVLERIVRATFRQAARYYLEVARVSSYDVATAKARLDLESPDAIREALGSGRQAIIVGMHYGSIELPVVFVSDLVGHHVTAPMELVADPGLRHWFVASRSRVGVRVVSIINARRTLLAALRRGESVGLVADRDMMGNGLPTLFFGHLAPIPAGPALLAIETGVPIYASSARRLKNGRYLGRMVLVPTPLEGTKRERVTAINRSITEAFEAILADAPEQWWGAFHPIWPDIAVAGHPETGSAA